MVMAVKKIGRGAVLAVRYYHFHLMASVLLVRFVLISGTDNRCRYHAVRPVYPAMGLIMKLGFPLPFTNHRCLRIGRRDKTLIDDIVSRRIIARIILLFWLIVWFGLFFETLLQLSIRWI